MCASWLEDKDLEEFWTKIEKGKDKDGKVLESVGKKALKNYVLNRSFDKNWIKKSRLEKGLESAPWVKKPEFYETKLLDFV
jgi:hypothetical protein